MTQTQIADILYESANETKQHLLEIVHFSDFDQQAFISILATLTKVGRTLPLSEYTFSLSEKLINYSFDIHSEDDYILFKNQYITILNTIIYETILFRKRYCIIQRNDPIPGLASHIITNLGQIALCLKEGYIPVIDMQFSENMFSTLNQNHTQNAWELFFQQPCSGTSLYDALSSDTCIRKDGIPSFMPNYSMDCLSNPHLLQFWKDVMKQYMPFSDTLTQLMQSTINDLPIAKQRTLGILCRGTDYLSLRPYNHPCQPDYHDIPEEALRVMKQYNCDYCYLATEDEEILAYFSKILGDKLLTSQKIYFSHEQENILSNVYKSDSTQLYNKNAEYLTSLYILSKCNCLLAGRTSGLIVTLLLNQTSYDHLHIWNEGKYGIDDTNTLQSVFVAPATET